MATGAHQLPMSPTQDAGGALEWDELDDLRSRHLSGAISGTRVHPHHPASTQRGDLSAFSLTYSECHEMTSARSASNDPNP
jgi:hypothetical protein